MKPLFVELREGRAVKRCQHCEAPIIRGVTCAACKGVQRVAEGTLVHPTSRYEDDPAAQMIASLGGATLELVGEAMGITRERVRQIEAAALLKLHERCLRRGILRSDVAATGRAA